MSPASAHCPQCGAPLPSDAPAGLCPRCVMAMNMAEPTELGPERVGPHGTEKVDIPRSVPRPEEIGQYFPQFEILQCLGRGGMGVVYKARQKSLDRLVAIKVLAPERERDPQFAGRFVREARTLAQMNHPNIVTVHDFGEAGGMFYLVMEFVDGVNLRQVLRERRLRSQEALAIVPSICEALQYAHLQGVIHRDIKPENLLLDKQGRIKITDFGIAKIMGAPAGPAAEGASGPEGVGVETGATVQSQIVGTPAYMAPEQTSAPAEVDHRADIYALGVVFYEMLTGELPSGKFEPPSHKVQLDVRIDEIVLQALAQDPQRRYQTAGQFKTMVETMATSQTRGDQPGFAPAGGGAAGGGMPAAVGGGWWRAVPWQVWVVIAMLGLEGLGNLISLPRQPQALLWLGAKVLFITGLLRRWRPVFILVLVVAAIHALYFLGRAPVVALANGLIFGLLIWACPFYFGRNWRGLLSHAGSRLQRWWADEDLLPRSMLPIMIATLLAALWGIAADLSRGHVGWFIFRMIWLPGLVLGGCWLLSRAVPEVRQGWIYNRRAVFLQSGLWVSAIVLSLLLSSVFGL